MQRQIQDKIQPITSPFSNICLNPQGKKETGRPIMMAPTGYETYSNGRFTEDDDQFIRAPGGSSPPPAYEVAVAERVRRTSASRRLGQSPPILAAFRTPQYGTQDQAHVSSVSPNSAYEYAVVVSGMAEMAGAQGQVYHHLPAPYPQISSSPPPSHSAQSLPLSVQVSHNLNTLPSPILNPPAQQSTISTAPTNLNGTWTPEQDRFVFRLDKDEGKSLQEISIALENVFHVERDANTIARRLVQLRARSKVWSDEQIKQAIQKAMQQLSPILLQEHKLSVTSLGNNIPLDSTTSSPITATDHEQLADVRLAVRLELDPMLRGSSVGDLEQRILNEQRERNAEYTAMITTDLGKDPVEDYEIV